MPLAYIYITDPARLVASRIAMGYSQARLARRIRVHPRTVRRWEKGQRTALSPEIAHRLAWAFGTTIEGAYKQKFYSVRRPAHDPNGKVAPMGRRYAEHLGAELIDVSRRLVAKRVKLRKQPRRDGEVVGGEGNGPEPPG